MLPVYLAGPDVFLPESAEVGRAKQAICARHGLEGRYPGDGPDVSGLPLGEQAHALFESCIEMMDACVAGLVNLTPFRGPSADVGTAFEMGYSSAAAVTCSGTRRRSATTRHASTTTPSMSSRSGWPTT